jgi:hypothetical protein
MPQPAAMKTLSFQCPLQLFFGYDLFIKQMLAQRLFHAHAPL